MEITYTNNTFAYLTFLAINIFKQFVIEFQQFCNVSEVKILDTRCCYKYYDKYFSFIKV